MKTDNNPAAFPCDKELHTEMGMSLRDWYAGMALQGLIASNISQLGEKHVTELTHNDWAIGAYKYADAMLAQRQKEQV